MTGIIDLSELDESTGLLLSSDELDWGNSVVSGIGDINGDGFDDFAIGFPDTRVGDNSRTGEVRVIFGSPSIGSDDIDLENLDGSNGFLVSGAVRSGELGLGIASGGDINGDGFDDLVISGYADYSGTYVIFGGTDVFPATFSVADLDGSNGFAIEGGYFALGTAVTIVGDINGDGFDDILLGGGTASLTGARFEGEAVVVFGTDAGFPASINVDDLDGTNGFRIPGVQAYGELGAAVAGADINGDGLDDIIISAPSAGAPLNSIWRQAQAKFMSFMVPQTDLRRILILPPWMAATDLSSVGLDATTAGFRP